MNSLFEHGKPVYGRLGTLPQHIDIDEFDYRTPFNRQITGIEKYLRFKRFQFISLNNSNYMVGLAVVDLGWVGHAFFYCYEHQRRNIREISHLQILGHATRVCNDEYGITCFEKGDLQIHIKKTKTQRHVFVKQEKRVLLDAAIDCTSVEPLSLCTPTGATGWTYTHKKTALPVTGMVRTKGKIIDLDSQKFMAAIDDTCGMLRPETAWYWLSLSGRGGKGQRLGLNLATGVNETSFSENSVWLDGRLSELAPVFFQQLSDHSWHIYSHNGDVDLIANTGWRRHESRNFIVVASKFSQWVSFISGKIRVQGEWITIPEQMGLLEQHYAKW